MAQPANQTAVFQMNQHETILSETERNESLSALLSDGIMRFHTLMLIKPGIIRITKSITPTVSKISTAIKIPHIIRILNKKFRVNSLYSFERPFDTTALTQPLEQPHQTRSFPRSSGSAVHQQPMTCSVASSYYFRTLRDLENEV